MPAVAMARVPSESFADLVARLTPAVVNIATTPKPPETQTKDPSRLEKLPPGMPRDEFFNYFNRAPSDESGPPPPTASLGSGFIVSADGYVVTNNHVIADAAEISVVMDDGARLKATLIGQDAKTDLALLKVEAGHMLPFVSFGDSDAARVGDWVLAVGNPFGLGNSVTAGIVSARGRDINAGPYDDFLQTDAPINRGNSGGPMFSLTGEVIGVNTLIYSPSGGSVGIGFATPAAIVKPVIEQLRKYGHTQRGWLGVRIQSMSDDLAQKLGLAKPTGALVAAVIESGPAAAAHLREGDVILRFNGKPVQNRHALPRIVADTEFGRRVEIVVWREGHELALTVELGRLEDFEASHASQEEKATPALTPKPSASLLGEPVWPVRWPAQPGH